MKKLFKNKKNWILSFILAFAVFLSVAVTIPQKTAKAEISGSITDFAWANYFDISNVDSVEPLNDSTSYSVSVTSRGFAITFIDPDIAYSGVSISFGTFSSSPTPDVDTGETYSFHCKISTDSENAPDLNAFSSIELRLLADHSQSGDTSTRYSAINYSSSVLNSVSSFNNRRYVLDVYITRTSWIEVGSTIYLNDICMNLGYSCYSYTPYFGSLTSIPNPLPFIVSDPSDYENPPSDDSSSDESSSSGSSPGSSSSDNSSSDDSSSDFVPSNDYEQGYYDGLKQSRYGLFNGAVLKTRFLMSNGTIGVPSSQFPISGLLFNGGLIFTPIAEWIEDSGMAGVQLTAVIISIEFPTPVILDSSSLSATGNNSAFVNSPTVVYKNNTTSTTSFVYNQTSTYHDLIVNTPYASSVSSLSDWYIYDYENLIGLTLYDSSTGYFSGYNVGFMDGREEGLSVGQSSAYEEGYIVGSDYGYRIGLSQGLSNDAYGLGEFMYTFLDMPGRIIANFLNFEFLNVNILGLVTFILSIALVAFVLKKVL